MHINTGEKAKNQVESLHLEYVNGVFPTGFLYFGFGGVGKGGGLERGWGGVGEGLGTGWGRVGDGLGRAWISLLQKPRSKGL